MANTLSTADLLNATGYQRPADVERCLEKQGIRFFWGKDGPWTTMDLINAAGGLQVPEASDSYAEVTIL
jgi:hypothetical protein